MENWNRFRGHSWQWKIGTGSGGIGALVAKWKIGTGSGATGDKVKLEQVQGALAAMENWNRFRGHGKGKLEQFQGALVGGGGHWWLWKIGTGSGGAGGNGKLEQFQGPLAAMANWNRFRGHWRQWQTGTGSGDNGGNGKLEQFHFQGALEAKKENWIMFRGHWWLWKILTGSGATNGKLEQVQGVLGKGGGHWWQWQIGTGSWATGGGLLGDLPLPLSELASAPAAELDERIVAVQDHRQEAEKGAGA
jgi:hypothetical protein